MNNSGPEIVNLQSKANSCPECLLRHSCLLADLEPADLDQVTKLVKHTRPLTRGHVLYRQGGPLRSLYIIRSGSVKATLTANDGAEQVTRFHLPGELLGTDAIANRQHYSSAIVLEHTALCELPFRTFEQFYLNNPKVASRVMAKLSIELRDNHELQLVIGQRTADERLAKFIVDLSDRFAAQGLSPTALTLSMSRYDIANYLGIAAETVSRVLARFENTNSVKVSRRQLLVADLPHLRMIANGSSQPSLQRAS